MVEHKRDVVHHCWTPSRPGPRLQHRSNALGKILSGGVDATRCTNQNAFSARREYRGGRVAFHYRDGLVDTGSPWMKSIFEEFKGTATWKSISTARW